MLVFEADESQLIALMEALSTRYPRAKVFSLPSMGENGSRRHVELGVRGDPAEVAQALVELRSGLERAGFPFREP